MHALVIALIVAAFIFWLMIMSRVITIVIAGLGLFLLVSGGVWLGGGVLVFAAIAALVAQEWHSWEG